MMVIGVAGAAAGGLKILENMGLFWLANYQLYCNFVGKIFRIKGNLAVLSLNYGYLLFGEVE